MTLDEETKKLIERLLLRGERMLGETCPVCGTPLFLIKSLGLRFCPKCRRYVIRSEEEYEKAIGLGIKPKDMIIVGFRPKEIESETPEAPLPVRRAKPKDLGDVIKRLANVVLKLVEDGKTSEAREVAEIIRILCACE